MTNIATTWRPPQNVGDVDPTISDAKAYLRARYGHAKDLDDSDIYTARFGEVIRVFAPLRNKEIRDRHPVYHNDPFVRTDGVYDWTVKTAVGVLKRSTPAPPPVFMHRPIYLFSAPGSGANNLVGPGNDVGVWAENVLKINHRRLNFPIGGYLGLMGGDPRLSYNEVIAAEAADLELQIEQSLRAEGLDPNNPATWTGTTWEAWFAAYSQSADGMKRAVAKLFGDGGRFEKLRSRINGLLLFGDPSRRRGPVNRGAGVEGYNPRGWGIARYEGPAWLEAVTYSITTDGDMYACAGDDTLLAGFYRWFVLAETELSFVAFSAGIVIPAITSYLGIIGPLFGGMFGDAGAQIVSAQTGVTPSFLSKVLGSGALDDPYVVQLRNDLSAKGMLSIGGITKLFKTLAALPGVQTHGEYWTPKPEFGGRTGIQVACDIMAGFRR